MGRSSRKSFRRTRLLAAETETDSAMLAPRANIFPVGSVMLNRGCCEDHGEARLEGIHKDILLLEGEGTVRLQREPSGRMSQAYHGSVIVSSDLRADCV